MEGYIKIYRKMLENPIVCKDADHIAIWVWLLMHAVWAPTQVMFHGEKITLHPGQLTTGRKKIASDLRVSESKVQRVLSCFESEQQIEQRTDRQCRLITIIRWDEYQQSEQPNEQQMNNDRTTSEQRVNTKKEIKNIRNNTNCAFDTDQLRIFDELWKLYPNKKGKSKVSKASLKAIAEIGKEHMARAIERYVSDLKKDEWRKPQYGSTFFNGGYVDYLDDNYQPPIEIPKKEAPPQKYIPEPPKYQKFEREEVRPATPMPADMREKIRRMT